MQWYRLDVNLFFGELDLILSPEWSLHWVWSLDSPFIMQQYTHTVSGTGWGRLDTWSERMKKRKSAENPTFCCALSVWAHCKWLTITVILPCSRGLNAAHPHYRETFTTTADCCQIGRCSIECISLVTKVYSTVLIMTTKRCQTNTLQHAVP